MISINIYEIIFQMINFFVLLWLMYKVLFFPLKAFLTKRENSIKNDLDQAQASRTKSEKLIEEQRQLLQEARLEGRDIRKKAEDTALTEREQTLAYTKAETERLIENAKKEAHLEFKKAKDELVINISNLTLALTEKVLDKQLDKNQHDNLIKEYLEKVKL
ncbi:F0F1 ATP synthase subunit B [Thermoproteota archaeon]